jgi:hypothetical protein
MSYIKKIVTLLWIIFVFWTSGWLFLWPSFVFWIFFLYRAMPSETYSCIFNSDLGNAILYLGIISLVFLAFGFVWSKIVLILSEVIHGQHYSDMTRNPKFSNLSTGLSKIPLWSVCAGLLFNTVSVVYQRGLCVSWF